MDSTELDGGQIDFTEVMPREDKWATIEGVKKGSEQAAIIEVMDETFSTAAMRWGVRKGRDLIRAKQEQALITLGYNPKRVKGYLDAVYDGIPRRVKSGRLEELSKAACNEPNLSYLVG